jgi:hypothetical protein
LLRQALKSGLCIFNGLPVFTQDEILGWMFEGQTGQPAAMD